MRVEVALIGNPGKTKVHVLISPPPLTVYVVGSFYIFLSAQMFHAEKFVPLPGA